MSDERIAELSAQIAAANDLPTEPANAAPAGDGEQPGADPEAQADGEQHEEAAASEEVDAKAKPGKKPGVHQRIDELTREKYEERRKVEALQRELDELKAAKAPPAAPEPSQANAKPTLEQCDFDPDKHEAALEKWAADKAVREYEEKRQNETREAEHKRLKAEFDSRLAAFEKESPGAWEAATKAPMNLTPPMLEVIATSERGPQIGVYLSQHLEEAERISKLSPIAAAAALGRIEASLSTPRQPEKQPSRAPAPASTLGSPAPAKREWGEMSTDEHIAAWKAKQQANR